MGLQPCPNPNVWGVCQPYNDKCLSLSISELRNDLRNLEYRLEVIWEKLESGTSMDADQSWEACLEVSRLHVRSAQVTAQMELKEFDTPHQRYQTWCGQWKAYELKLQYDSWTLCETLMKKNKSRFKNSFTSYGSFERLFITSQIGYWPTYCKSERAMTSQMVEKYCPKSFYQLDHWDPILQQWHGRWCSPPSHLFPRSEKAFMDEIFVAAKGEINEVFTPHNGLFIALEIQEALDKGYIAIVPDIDLEPIEPWQPFNNAEFEKVKAWEDKSLKDYKIIVIDKQHEEVKVRPLEYALGKDIKRLIDLHNRKLIFITDFRPRERYIWWTFLNAILHTYWRGDLNARHVQHELRKYTRYWGRGGKYVKKSQLLGLVQELGPDVGSLLAEGLEKRDGERLAFEAVHALVEAAAVKSVKDVD